MEDVSHKNYKMERTFSKDWCQGFCTKCGTGCAEHSEDLHQVDKERKALQAEVDRLTAASKISYFTLERVKNFAEEAQESAKKQHDQQALMAYDWLYVLVDKALQGEVACLEVDGVLNGRR
jgi:hypothetical protein